jgi:hypothetical protein
VRQELQLINLLLFFAIFSSCASSRTNFKRSVASDPTQVQLIPEILNLKNHKVSKDVFEQNDSRTIGKNLILRTQNEESKDVPAKNPIYDFYNDTSIKMFFPQGYTSSILSEGFLNAWQTHHGNQWVTEDNFIDMTFPRFQYQKNTPIDEALKVEPKYAYLSMDVERPGIWKTHLDTRYGEVVAVFKNVVKSRTTFTPGNSALRIHEDYRSVVPIHTLSYKTDKNFPEPDTSDPVMNTHWEAQIWGELTIDDVDYFMVNCPFNNKTVDPDNLKLLEDTRIPVYQCGVDPDISRVFPKDRISN